MRIHAATRAVVLLIVVVGAAGILSGSASSRPDRGSAGEFSFAAGTFYQGGLFNLAAFAFREAGYGLPSRVTIVGPDGWNNNDTFSCQVRRFPGMAPGLGVCWGGGSGPRNGTYRATPAETALAPAASYLDAESKAVAAPPLTITSSTSSGADISWAPYGSDRAGSYLVALTTANAGCCQTAALVVPATQRSVRLSAPLVPGQEYLAQIFSFPIDMTRSVGLEEKWNMSYVAKWFRVPGASQSITLGSLRFAPMPPRAGRTLLVSASYSIRAAGVPTLDCSASVGSYPARVVYKRWQPDARCLLVVPAGTAGSRLRGALSVVAGGQRVTRNFSLRISR